MKARAALLLALLAPAAPAATPAYGFVDLSVGASWRELDDDPPFDQLELEYDTGTLARLEVGTHYDSGLLLRVGYAYTAYDELRALGSLTVTEDIQQQELRAGVFYATPRRPRFGWRLGGGYAYADEDTSTYGYYQRGGFVEAAAVIAAHERVTVDLAAAFAKLGGPANRDAEVAEVRATAVFHARVMDFTVGTRYALADRDNAPDEQPLELRVGVVIPWAYPESAPD